MSREELERDLPQETKDLLALIRAGRRDPVCFAEKILDVRLHPCQKLWLWMTTKTQPDLAFEIGLTLNDGGRELWKTREEFDALRTRNPDFLKNILVPSNRWGKTLVTSVKHIWYNFYKIGARGTPEHLRELRCGTLNISPHSNQCQAGYDYIMDILFSRFSYVVDGVSYKNECKIPDFYLSDNTQKRLIMFKNGTSYRAVPTGEDQAASLAGTRYLYISYDEAAQSLHLKAELPAKIMSRLIDFGGPLDLVSTPEVDKPSHQYFFHIAKLGMKGEEGWFTIVGKIADNIFLGEKEVRQISDSIKSTDPVKYRQVVYGEFVTTGKKMFDAILVERLWDRFTPEPVLYDHRYLLSIDWGFADTGDPTVFYVLDYTELLNERVPAHKRMVRIAYREAIRGGSPFAVLTRARMLQREWNGAKLIHDSGNMGGVIIRKMMNEMQMHDIVDFVSSGGQKTDMLFVLLNVMSSNRQTSIDSENKVTDLNPEFGQLRGYHIAELEEQMGNYQYNPDKGVSDKRIEQDDVMCLGMGVWYIFRKLIRAKMEFAGFNPLADKLEQIFPLESAKTIGVRSVTIPEKRIF